MVFMLKYFLFIISLFSFVFSYENKFSYDISSNDKKIKLTHTPELIEVSGGYTRLARIGEGHFTEVGKPELPTYTTYYQLDPLKTYEFELEILESQIIENITVMPHQGMDKWEVASVLEINEDIYSSNDHHFYLFIGTAD